MRLAAQIALGVWLALAMTGLCAWATWTWAMRELSPDAWRTNKTSVVVWYLGLSCVWGGTAAVLGAGATAVAIAIWGALR